MNLKYFLFSLCLICFSNLTLAQTRSKSLTKEEQGYYIFYLGTSTGTNGINGKLGINGEVHIYKGLTIQAGIGLGSWSKRSTIGLHLYHHYPKGLYYAASFSSNPKETSLKMDLELANGQIHTVKVKINKVQTINLATGYQFDFYNNKIRLNFEGGYAIPLQIKPYELPATTEISETSKKILDLNAPGGIILFIGLSFGFN